MNYNLTARSIQRSEDIGVISHKKGKNMLKKTKIFEKLHKNYRTETKFGKFFQKGRKGSIGAMVPELTKTTMKIKNTSHLLMS